MPTLLLVDVQPEWYHTGGDTHKAFPHFVARITQLLAYARTHGFRVVHIRSKYDMTKRCTHRNAPEHVTAADTRFTKWHKLFRRMHPKKPTALSGKPLPCARALAHESVVYKPTFDAFLGTRLHTLLQSTKTTKITKATRGDNVVWVAGLLTSVCVHHTAHGAFARGYDVHVVIDCCADRSRARHDAAVALYGGYVWRVVQLLLLLQPRTITRRRKEAHCASVPRSQRCVTPTR